MFLPVSCLLSLFRCSVRDQSVHWGFVLCTWIVLSVMPCRPNVIINEVVALLVSFLNCKLISGVLFIVHGFFFFLRFDQVHLIVQCFSCKQKVEYKPSYFHIERSTVEIVDLRLLTIRDNSNLTILTYCIQPDF